MPAKGLATLPEPKIISLGLGLTISIRTVNAAERSSIFTDNHLCTYISKASTRIYLQLCRKLL